ncbi:MAG: hypothetical protein LKE40_04745 [Spirochaetia bacterium]|jgi:hypothetical protein|nr:hypothetical protein [Spirochaetia bacterium]
MTRVLLEGMGWVHDSSRTTTVSLEGISFDAKGYRKGGISPAGRQRAVLTLDNLAVWVQNHSAKAKQHTMVSSGYSDSSMSSW